MRSNLIPAAARSSAVHALAIAGLAAMLAGCSTTSEVTGGVAQDYRQRHPLVLKESPQALELFIGSKRGTLNGSQRAEVLAFAAAWRREATGGILIDLPAGTSNEFAAASALREVRAILAAAAVPPEAVSVRPYRPADPHKMATLGLHYPRVVADVGPCGMWPHDLGPTWDREHLENREYWNLGCAARRNLAAMVDNPADLVQPRSETPAYTGRRTTVLDKFHRGESTSVVYPDNGKGKISDVGQ
jgi:pilus assembly protein CpaD